MPKKDIVQGRWTINTVKDPDTGELLLDLGLELCEQLGWQPGDEVEWIDNKDGTWTIQKKTASQSI